MGQMCSKMPWNCFLSDDRKVKSDEIDKRLAREKLYYKRQVCCWHLLFLRLMRYICNVQFFSHLDVTRRR